MQAGQSQVASTNLRITNVVSVAPKYVLKKLSSLSLLSRHQIQGQT